MSKRSTRHLVIGLLVTLALCGTAFGWGDVVIPVGGNYSTGAIFCVPAGCPFVLYYSKDGGDWKQVGGVHPCGTDVDIDVIGEATGEYTVRAQCDQGDGQYPNAPNGIGSGEIGTVWVVAVDIDTPATFPAYLVVDENLALGSTVTPVAAQGGTYAWTKVTGPGTVTFGTSTSEDPTFSADAAGEYTVKVEYTIGDLTVDDTSGTIYVMEVDLDAADVEDADEVTVGAFVGLNDDDDDSDGVIDNVDTNGVAGENDLLAITLQEVQPTTLPGTDTVTLTWTNDAKIDVFENSNKTNPISSGQTYQLNALPKTLYVEGDAASATLRDIEIKLEYTKGGATCDDKVKVTVVKVDLDAADVSDADELSVGAFVGVNDDDDDSDGVIDNVDTNGVAGENDLLAITLQEVLPTDLPGTDTVTLTWTSVDVFENSDKTNPISSGQTYQLNALPKTLYVEGDAASGALRDIEIKLEYTKGEVTIDDKIKVTVVKVDLDIYNGQAGSLVPETDQDSDAIEDEEDIGAFAVANLNDTNGDGYADNDDNHRPVTANGNLGDDEDDLMKLVLRKPLPTGVGGTVKLTIESGNVKIWSDGIKTTEETTLEFSTNNFVGDTIEWYVEARAATALQGISLEYEFKPTGTDTWLVLDRVKATGVWATCTDIVTSSLTQQQVRDRFDGHNGYVGSNPDDSLASPPAGSGGTGVRSNRNCVVLEFRVMPNNVTSVPLKYGDGTTPARPLFDISRQSEFATIDWYADAPPQYHKAPVFFRIPGHALNPKFPENHHVAQHNEWGNDDAADGDEKSEPGTNGYIWAYDGPGGASGYYLTIYRFNFKEFVRVRFDGIV